MGIFAANVNGGSGQQAAVHWLEQISNNIANAQTPGFKRGETTFIDLVRDVSGKRPFTGGVMPYSRSTNSIQGDIKSSDTSTHMSLKGNGYYAVSTATDTTDGRILFNDRRVYTRRGDFETDQYGYLVNGAGYYLNGIAIDAKTGNTVGDSPELIKVETDFLPPRATTKVEYRANLASHPSTANADDDVPGSELLKAADFTQDPTAAGTGIVQGADLDTFLDSTVSGGALTAYNSVGAGVNLQLRWAKIDSADLGGNNTWNLFYQNDDNAAGTEVAWKNVGEDFEFDSEGNLVSPTGSVALNGLVAHGITIGDVDLEVGTAGLSQFDNSGGAVEVTLLAQDGYGSGEFRGVDITAQGRVRIAYSNGKSVDIAEVAVVRFNAENQLKHLDGAAFQQTIHSGAPILVGSPDIQPATLESANLDVAEEVIKMMSAQYYFSSNLKTMSIAGDMHKEFLNIVR